MVKEWGLHSSLLQVIRHMHSEFERNPPMPENMSKSNLPIPGGDKADEF